MLILSGVHHQPCHDMGGSVWCPHQGSWSQGSFVDSRLPVPVLTQKGQNEVTLTYLEYLPPLTRIHIHQKHKICVFLDAYRFLCVLASFST